MEYHNPVLLKESVDGLNIHPDGIYVYVTLGGMTSERNNLKTWNKWKVQIICFDQRPRCSQTHLMMIGLHLIK
jgi:16S rRNA (cytosine1402-N4)-methyltransferase